MNNQQRELYFNNPLSYDDYMKACDTLCETPLPYFMYLEDQITRIEEYYARKYSIKPKKYFWQKKEHIIPTYRKIIDECKQQLLKAYPKPKYYYEK